MKLLAIVLLALGLAATTAFGGTIAVENNRLSVSYDSSVHRFTLIDRAAGKTVIAEGQLRDAPVADAHVRVVEDAVFGKGRQIRVTPLCVLRQKMAAFPNRRKEDKCGESDR